MGIKQTVQDYLSTRSFEIGETIQYGWFIFKITGKENPPQIESLDFRQMASFTNDFSEAERIDAAQTSTLLQFNASVTPCTLRQSAIVSKSYVPGLNDIFLERQTETNANDSGWYIGVTNETRDMDDPDSFTRHSLYELSINDMRMVPYWLLPVKTIVSLA